MNRKPTVPAVALGLLFLVGSLPAAIHSWKTEIKLLVNTENAAQAIHALKLDERQAVKEIVCYFDTGDGALEAHQLILRARQKAGQPGESTVKLLATAGATDLSDEERAIQPEQDWTDEYQSKASGLGEPSGLTKTRMVLDFFKPGGP